MSVQGDQNDQPAGWAREWRQLLKDRPPRAWDSLSWLSLRALSSSVNDIIGKGAPQLVTDLRSRWVADAPPPPADGRWDEDLVVPMPDATSFVIVGDTGEQDASQYAVAPALADQDAALMVILSDVIYPAGDVNDYVDGFYRPYEKVDMPIFALPGNHDWYDGLNGFMWHFCGRTALPAEVYARTSYRPRTNIARFLWKLPSAPKYDVLAAWRQARADPEPWRPLQPGPYFAIDTPSILLVCIDTGITGDIDWQQGDWLARVSKRPKDKLLLTGKPLVVNNQHKPCRIAPETTEKPPAYATVDAIVRDPDHRYVATIGGDIHNYQHYTPKPAASRQAHYLVSGGGGAFMSATHPNPGAPKIKLDKDLPLEACGLEFEKVEYYPSRTTSLRFYSELLVPRLWRLVRGILGVMAGLLIASVVVLAADPSGDERMWFLVGCATALALWLLIVWHGVGQITRDKISPWRHVVSFFAFVVLGAVLALAGRSLVSEDDFWKGLVLVGGLLAFGAGTAWLYRKRRWWRPTWKAVVAYLIQTIGVIAALILFLIEVDPEGGWWNWRIWATVAGTIVFLIAAPLVVDRFQRWWPKGYRVATAIVAGLLVGLLFVLEYVVGSWVPEAAEAVAVLLALLVLGVLTSHLVFLAAFALVWRWHDQNGCLSEKEAEAGLKWREDERRFVPPDDIAAKDVKRMKRILNLVHPGEHRGKGPLQEKVSEIVDKDEPPFYKHFLRLDVVGNELVVEAIGVTGTEESAEKLTPIETFTIGLTPPRTPDPDPTGPIA